MSRHVLIIGGGIIGLSTAYYAARAGLQVTLLDRAAAQRDGCSFGNAGLIVPSHFIPLAAPGMVALGLKWMWNPRSAFYIKPRLSWELWRWCYRFWRCSTLAHVQRSAPLLRDLNLASRRCYEELAEAAGNAFHLEKRGLLLLCQTAHGLAEETRTAELAHRLGIVAEVLDPQQVAAMEPNIQMDVRGGVYYPGDCQLSPRPLMDWLQKQIESLGVQVHWQTEVTGWRCRGGHIEGVVTDREELCADEYVLAGGSWSEALARLLGLALPMQAGKGYSLTLAHPRQLPDRGAILTEARVAVTPMGSSLRFGGTMELAGMDERIKRSRVEGIIDAALRYYPNFKPEDFKSIEPWCGLRPCSPDGLPYVGRTRHCANLVVATGHAMMGISLGPITGRLVTDALLNRRATLDLSLLLPDRFG